MTREQRKRRRNVIIRGIVFAVLLGILYALAKAADPEQCRDALAVVGSIAVSFWLSGLLWGVL